MVVSTVLAAAWPFNDFEKGVELESLDALQLLFVWGYVLGMFLVQGTSKYFFFQTLLAYDFEGIKTSADLQAVRAKELLGESVEAKVDVLEVVVKELSSLDVYCMWWRWSTYIWATSSTKFNMALCCTGDAPI
jgi:hypothetical protein